MKYFQNLVHFFEGKGSLSSKMVFEEYYPLHFVVVQRLTGKIWCKS
jgi:hypothetical protein